MNIVIGGLGEVGSHVAEVFVREGHNVSLIEKDEAKARRLEEEFDGIVVSDSATSIEALKAAKVPEADLFFGLSSDDEVNLVAASLAKALGAGRVGARCHGTRMREQRHFSFGAHFGIDYLFSPEKLAAASLARFIRSPLSPIVDQFAWADIEVMRMEIERESPVIGGTLKEVRLPDRMRVGLVERGEHIFIPDAGTRLQPGDVVTLIGLPAALGESVRWFSKKGRSAKRPRIVVYGGGDVGSGLIAYFNESQAEVKLIEPDRSQCEKVSEEFPWIDVIEGHATESRLLLQENIMTADCFVAATRDDENNVLACLQAAKLGIESNLLVIHRPDYAGVMTDLQDVLGIEMFVSPRLATSENLMRLVTREPYIVLWTAPRDYAEILQWTVTAEQGHLIARKVRDIRWPKGAILLGIQRPDGSVVPTADDVLREGDALLVLVQKEKRSMLLAAVEHEG